MPKIGLIDPLLQSLPLWLIALLLIIVSALGVHVGSWIARRQLARARAKGEREPRMSNAQGFVVGAIFGLLAFLIGLTFSIALDRYDARRAWASEEATAISTAYLRADLLDEPNRSQLRQAIREYTRTRIVPDGLTREEAERREAESERLQTKLWEETRVAVFPFRQTDLGSQFVGAMNNMLDVGTRRWIAGMEQIPSQILDIQLVYLIVSGAALGYILRVERESQRWASNVLMALFVLAFVMILDIDRPRAGTIRVSQQGLEQLLSQMNADAIRDAASTNSVAKRPK